MTRQVYIHTHIVNIYIHTHIYKHTSVACIWMEEQRQEQLVFEARLWENIQECVQSKTECEVSV